MWAYWFPCCILHAHKPYQVLCFAICIAKFCYGEIGGFFVKYHSYFASLVSSISPHFILHFYIEDVCKIESDNRLLFKWSIQYCCEGLVMQPLTSESFPSLADHPLSLWQLRLSVASTTQIMSTLGCHLLQAGSYSGNALTKRICAHTRLAIALHRPLL